jgi:hypothetical protein
MWLVGPSLDLKMAHNPKVAGSNPAPATMACDGPVPSWWPGMRSAQGAPVLMGWAGGGRRQCLVPPGLRRKSDPHREGSGQYRLCGRPRRLIERRRPDGSDQQGHANPLQQEWEALDRSPKDQHGADQAWNVGDGGARL